MAIRCCYVLCSKDVWLELCGFCSGIATDIPILFCECYVQFLWQCQMGHAYVIQIEHCFMAMTQYLIPVQRKEWIAHIDLVVNLLLQSLTSIETESRQAVVNEEVVSALL